jgi:acyl-CoA reductase-like NAD-dependent aldehyde dehydrogenase
MRVMRDESFGPVVGIMPVDSDDEALAPDERLPVRPDRLALDRDAERAARIGAGSRPAPCS